jgi:hypothetical protein
MARIKVLGVKTPPQPAHQGASAQRTGWMMLITGVAALGFKAGPQQDLPPAFGTRSILQRVDQSNSENNATDNASWRGSHAAAAAAGPWAVAVGGAGATGGAATVASGAAAAAFSRPSLGPGWAPSPAPPTSGAGSSSVPPPPAAPPAAIDMTSPAAQAVFAVASGALGLLFALLGQRVWRAFLALSALFATGGLVFYLLMHNVAAVPLWADGVIAGCLGALAAALAFFFSVVGLLACSAAAGFLLTWAILRVSSLAAVLDAVTPGAELMVACAVAALVLLCVLACECGAGWAQCNGRPRRATEEAAPRSPPRSPGAGRQADRQAGRRSSRSFRSTRSPRSPRHRHTCATLGEALTLTLTLTPTLGSNPNPNQVRQAGRGGDHRGHRRVRRGLLRRTLADETGARDLAVRHHLELISRVRRPMRGAATHLPRPRRSRLRRAGRVHPRPEPQTQTQAQAATQTQAATPNRNSTLTPTLTLTLTLTLTPTLTRRRASVVSSVEGG